MQIKSQKFAYFKKKLYFCSVKRRFMAEKTTSDKFAASCEACKLREMCNPLDHEECIPRRKSWWAVVLAYVVPFIVLIGVVIGLQGRLDNEPLVGTIALCSVGVYYILLKLFGKEIEKRFKK